ncbi:hypothetical protein BV22DRAFT_1041711 [Leucogyrophana mollusca]|uniref:Uncharacterized protein n=1 Tax=Leucogyrophana mollusca TaxID=85980 RepID=A0ACB8B1F1_9AGAM|nr:hypothetical protein BV22DRAFT_1041711 [Leucogyrophana mollusca]
MSFSLTAYTRLCTALLSMFSLSSTPPPYNHSRYWSVGCGSEAFMHISPCVVLPVPYNSANARYSKCSPSIPLAQLFNQSDAEHHNLLKASEMSSTTSAQKATVAAPVLCSGVDLH